jgi:hypothetical protein
MDKNLYSHTTSKENLIKILKSGKIMSLKHIANKNPSKKVDVQHGNFWAPRERLVMKAKDAYKKMKERGKDVDSIFLIKNEIIKDPSYGNYTIIKSLKSPKESKRINLVPNEYLTRRAISISKKSATIYTPDEEVLDMRSQFPNYDIKPMSLVPLKRGASEISLSKFFKNIARSGLEKISKDLSQSSVNTWKKKFGGNPMLAGSLGLGTNIDNSDTDIYLHYKNKKSYEKAIERLKNRYNLDSPIWNELKTDKHTLTGEVNGQQVDLVLGQGPKAEAWFSKFKEVRDKLTPEERAKIIRRKKFLKKVPLASSPLYKLYKKHLDSKMGLKRLYF